MKQEVKEAKRRYVAVIGRIYYLLLLIVCFISPSSATAATLHVPRTPAPLFADGEATTNTAISSAVAPWPHHFRLALTCYAAASNSLTVTFGTDSLPQDNTLAAEESDLIIGWDSGHWIVRPKGLRERYHHTPTDSQLARERTLLLTVTLNRHGIPQTLAFADDLGEFEFQGLKSDPPPAWLAPANWDLLRVTSRGTPNAAEQLKAKFTPEGAVIILR